MSPETSDASSPQPLRSKHSSNLPGLREQLGISILAIPCRAGRRMLLRTDGARVARPAPRQPGRLAVGYFPLYGAIDDKRNIAGARAGAMKSS